MRTSPGRTLRGRAPFHPGLPSPRLSSRGGLHRSVLRPKPKEVRPGKLITTGTSAGRRVVHMRDGLIEKDTIIRRYQ